MTGGLHGVHSDIEFKIENAPAVVCSSVISRTTNANTSWPPILNEATDDSKHQTCSLMLDFGGEFGAGFTDHPIALRIRGLIDSTVEHSGGLFVFVASPKKQDVLS